MTTGISGQRIPVTDSARRYQADGYWSGRTIWDQLHAVVEERGDHVAVVDRSGQVSFEGLLIEAERMADSLGHRGVGAGDRFVVQLPNRYEAVVLHLALTRLGAITVNVPVTYRIGELEAIFRVAEPVGMAVPGEGRHAALVDLIPRLTSIVPSLSVTLAVGGGERSDVPNYRDLVAAGRQGLRSPAILHDQAVTFVAFTSGTIGEPKGVMHTSATLEAINESVVRAYGLAPNDVIFMAAPVGHSIGFMHGIRLSIFLGATVVFTDTWDAGEASHLIGEHGATFTVLAVPHLHDAVRTWQQAPRSLRIALCGGSPIPPRLMRAAHERFPLAWTSPLWGMTEGIGTACRVGCPEEKLFTTDGEPFPGTELRVLSPDGQVVPPGTEGHLAMLGPQLFVGYFRRPDLNEECFLSDGFFLTGDQATMDADGYVRIVGRLKDLIIRGGVNIAPASLERVLADDPRVDQVAVVGFPDERLGERVCAVVVPRRGARIVLDDLIARVRDAGLAKHSWPERLILAKALPTTPTRKIRKGELRDTVASLPLDADTLPES